jgi:hypothetical protein
MAYNPGAHHVEVNVARKELAVVAAVPQVIDVSWLDVTIGRGIEKAPIEAEKGHEIFTQEPFYALLTESCLD